MKKIPIITIRTIFEVENFANFSTFTQFKRWSSDMCESVREKCGHTTGISRPWGHSALHYLQLYTGAQARWNI